MNIISASPTSPSSCIDGLLDFVALGGRLICSPDVNFHSNHKNEGVDKVGLAPLWLVMVWIVVSFCSTFVTPAHISIAAFFSGDIVQHHRSRVSAVSALRPGDSQTNPDQEPPFLRAIRPIVSADSRFAVFAESCVVQCRSIPRNPECRYCRPDQRISASVIVL